MRESDGDHFLWNGEGCVRVSPVLQYSEYAEERKWHHDYGEIPESERIVLDKILVGAYRVFEIKGHGRYQVVARGEFRDS